MKSYRYLFLPVPVFLALALLAALWFAAPQRTQATGTLALHLPLDETAGATTFSDASGNGHNAACTGAACPIAGVAGQEDSALQFDGVDDYLEVPYAASLNPGSFTVMAWAKATGGAGTYRSVITSRGDGYGYTIYATAANEWQFWIGHGSGWEYLGNTPVVEGEWIHLAGVYDGVTRDMNFYVNGEAAGSLSNRYLSPNPQWPLRVGAGATEQAPVFFFNGLIDDVRVYDGALTQVEIQDVAVRGLQALDDVYTGRENASLSVPAPGVLANDILTGSGPLTATLMVAPTAGDLSLALDGSFVYTPALDFIGTDVFTYTAHARELTATAVVTLTVEPNYPPVAISDRYTTTQGVPVTALQTNSLTSAFDGVPGVAGNMFDVTAAETIRITGFDVHVATGNHTVEVYYKTGSYVGAEQTPAAWTLLGSQTVVGQGQGQPTPVQIGDLTIPAGQTYALYVTVTGSGLYYTHSGGVYEDGALTLTVGVANTYPFGTIFSPRSWNGTIHYESRGTVLANDSDANGDALTASLETGPAHGDLVFSADGSFIYTPTLPFMGDDTFTYSAGDGELTDTAVVTITVGANNPPLAANDAYTTTINMPLSVAAPGLLANDTDPEGLPLSASLGDPPAQGTVVISPDGSFIYTPATDFLGQDSFTYLADDGVGTATAVVTLNVIEPSCHVEATGDDVTDYASGDASAVQTAVDNAAPGALIRVAGACAGVQMRDGRTQTLAINQNLTVQGGYTASDWSLPPDPDTYPTTLDAQSQGRVVYISSGVAVTLDGLLITGGSSTGSEGGGDGGGIYNEGTLTITNSTVSGNNADSYGGGIYNDNYSVLAMRDSAINDNVTGYDGGGIENYGALTLEGCTLSGNVSGNRGGGIDQWAGTLVVSNTIFAENDANEGGGVYANEPITLKNVTFTGNNASTVGGAIYFNDSGGGSSIANGLFVGNGEQHIGYTGGSVTAQPHFVNCTFYGATSEAVRIVSFGSGPPIDFSNSIFWGNNGDITNNDAALNVQNSIVEESAYPGSGNLNADPLFVDAAGGNLRLAQGSPAIDAGDNGLLPAALTTDLDGLARIVAGTVDMGIYESQYEQRCSPSLTLGAHTLGDVQPITLDFTDLGDLACVTATYFPVSHPHATVPLQSGAFWTISGENAAGDPVTSGFTATLTLPFSGGDATTRACRWLEGTGPGAGWDCGEDALTTYDAGNGQVSRDEVTEFSDWAAGSDVGPTAVTLQTLTAHSTNNAHSLPLMTLLVLLLSLGGVVAWRHQQ